MGGEKITQAIANTIRGNGQSPGGARGTIQKGKERRKKKQRHNQGETCKSQNRNKRQRKEARRGKARRANQGAGQGQVKRTNHANLHGKSLNQEEGRRQPRQKEKNHECSELTVHEFGTKRDKNKPVLPPWRRLGCDST